MSDPGAPDADEITRVEKNLRDEVRRRIRPISDEVAEPDPWWEARVVVHVQAPTRLAADDVISSLFDRDERCKLFEDNDG